MVEDGKNTLDGKRKFNLLECSKTVPVLLKGPST